MYICVCMHVYSERGGEQPQISNREKHSLELPENCSLFSQFRNKFKARKDSKSKLIAFSH